MPNITGFIVGNGFTDRKYDTLDNVIDMSYWYGLIDARLFELLKLDGCSLGLASKNQSEPCQRHLSEFVETIQGINPYDVFKGCNTDYQQLEPTLYSGKAEGIMKCGNEIAPVKRYYSVSEFSKYLDKD